MRLSSLSYGRRLGVVGGPIIGLFVGGCSNAPAGSTDSPETASQVSALTAAQPAGNARARGPRLGELDTSSAALSAAAPAAPATYAATLATSLPTSVDNSKGKSFPEIRNRGGLGSCEAFAIGYYQATYEIGRLAGWDNQSAASTNATKMSPKWFYNMNNEGENAGTTSGQHYDLLTESGALTWADFPYDGDASNPLNYRQWPLGTMLWNKALRV